jgi:hypothetical protein
VTSDDSPSPPPLALRIVRGEPTPEELAALTAIVGAAGEPLAGAVATSWPEGAGPEDARPVRARGRWNDPRYGHRRYWPVGPNGWRTAR